MRIKADSDSTWQLWTATLYKNNREIYNRKDAKGAKNND